MSVDRIEWWAAPHENAVWYRHVGCDTTHRRWLIPMDDCPLPYEEATEECAHCCLVRPLVATGPFKNHKAAPDAQPSSPGPTHTEQESE